MSKPIVFLNSHPIQYFAPLYKQANEQGVLVEALYCSDETLQGFKDQQFGVEIKWDLPLLNGYPYTFLKNHSPKPSIYNGFFGLLNFGLFKFLKNKPKSIVVVHGWAYATHVMTIVAAKMFGHKVCLRAETPLNQEQLKSKLKVAIKNVWLRFLFQFIDNFLFIGQQNRKFYQQLGVKEKKLFFVPYSVDNKRFQEVAASISKQEARSLLKLPTDKKIFLYSGKYIEKKNPLHLLEAFAKMSKRADCFLVMVGDGELRERMELFIKQQQLENAVLLTGFINQSQIPYYYASADFFVMCSGLGETWGLSVNEAMNFGLPIIVSNLCGSADDLVEDGVNGFVFETGNINQLSSCLENAEACNSYRQLQMGEASLNKINQYSYTQVIDTLKQLSVI